MKNIKTLLLVSVIAIGTLASVSCTKNLDKINVDPDNPAKVPTNTIFTGANRSLFNYTRDGWWGARMTLPWMQYMAQNNYVTEDQYQYRETQAANGWGYLYRSAINYKDIIEICENPARRAEAAVLGDIDNQISVSRIMMAYIFDILVTHFGDVPYWSYGQRDNPNFQALNIESYMTVAYATQEEIYADILKELKEASQKLKLDQPVFRSGDKIYNGDANKWKKLANSLRLRIANRIKDVYPAANAEIEDAIKSGVFTSNADNAIHLFTTSSAEASPFWRTFYVDNRTDFFVNRTFLKLLTGKTGGFGVDPRLYNVAAPKGLTFRVYNEQGYRDSEDMNDYPGMPYGLPTVETYYQQIANINIFAKDYLRADRGEVMMEYSEVAFILSELNGWGQSEYENGVRANMERLRVPPASIAQFMSKLPSASMRNVLTQKYVTLFYNPDESWNEYRRTGYPDAEILLMPGKKDTRPHDGTEYTFTPLRSGNVVASDLPARIR
ncbi:MAG: SusD/RagB family nutrient-binding outer membrane lipoprotein, partial [Sphingobacterium sp.]|nr:SusD/RagB family nutrient-binding outer membrane lipoprotein [Sphingobacterium sp.]